MSNDVAMKELKNVIIKRWLDDQVAECVKPYFKQKDELAIHYAFVYRGEFSFSLPFYNGSCKLWNNLTTNRELSNYSIELFLQVGVPTGPP